MLKDGRQTASSAGATWLSILSILILCIAPARFPNQDEKSEGRVNKYKKNIFQSPGAGATVLVQAMLLFAVFITAFAFLSAADQNVKTALKEKILELRNVANSVAFSTPEMISSLSKMETDVDGDSGGSDKLERLNAMVDGAKGAVEKFASGGVENIMSGILDMSTVALETFGGPMGAVMVSAIGFISALFGGFMGSKEATPSIGEVMKEALDDFRDTVLFDKMNAFTATFQGVHEGIIAVVNKSKTTEGKDLSRHDITVLNQEIKTFEATLLLEEVKATIQGELESDKIEDTQKALKTLNVYCKLQAVVELVVWEFIIYIQGESIKQSSLPVFYTQLLNTRRKRDKDWFEFLNYPPPKYGMVANMFQYDPTKYQALGTYVDKIKLNPIPEDPNLGHGKEIVLKNKQFSGWYSYLSKSAAYPLKGDDDLHDVSKFKLVAAGSDKNSPYRKATNVFRLESAKESWSGYYVAGEKRDACNPKHTYPPNINTVRGIKYPLTLKRVRGLVNCYYAASSNRVFQSYNFEWKFTRLNMKGKTCPHYIISAAAEGFGPEYILYMSESASAAAQLKFGWPGDKGIWKIKNC